MMIIVLLMLTAGNEALPSDGFGRQVVAEANLARTQPRRYAQYLRELRRSYWGKFYRAPGSVATVVTSEGGAAVDEAIAFMERQSPLPPLTWSDGLAEAAAELVRDEGQNGDVGHQGLRSGTMQQRIERHGTWSNRIAENIGYGPEDPRLMVMELIIDDGVPDRGHRKNIFSRAFNVAGAACGPHPVYRNMCVIDFASFFSK
ncbi:serine protease [Geomonas sp. Red276]